MCPRSPGAAIREMINTYDRISIIANYGYLIQVQLGISILLFAYLHMHGRDFSCRRFSLSTSFIFLHSSLHITNDRITKFGAF